MVSHIHIPLLFFECRDQLLVYQNKNEMENKNVIILTQISSDEMKNWQNFVLKFLQCLLAYVSNLEQNHNLCLLLLPRALLLPIHLLHTLS